MAEKRTGASAGEGAGGARKGSRPKAPDGADDGGELRSSAEVRTALIEGNTFRGRGVQYVVIDGLAMFEGDIVLGTEEEVEARTESFRAERAAGLEMAVVRTGNQFRWPNCTVPYTIDAALPDQGRVTTAIAHWEANTRFRFPLRTTQADYVTFRPAGGCSSAVGRSGGQQFVNLGPSCTAGNTIHEIGHVVGLWHEQSREDRDSFVTINWTRITSGFEHNFNQHITDGDDVGAYDYGSIMHYPRNAFSVDGSDTITPVSPGVSIGQRTALSAGDMAAANSMCPPVVKMKEVVKDQVKDVIVDTRKESLKDARFDTRKEMVVDTRKEVTLDPPIGKRIGTDPPFLPGLGEIRTGGGFAIPFAVATSHHAPGAAGAAGAGAAAAAGGAGDLGATIAALDAELASLSEQIAGADAARSNLQARYDELSTVLQQAVQENDQA